MATANMAACIAAARFSIHRFSAIKSLSVCRFYSRKVPLHDESNEESVPYIVYKGALTNQIRIVKTFSLGTSMMGLALQPMVYQQLSVANGLHSALLAAASVVGVFTIFTPFLIHLITRRYVTELAYDPSNQTYSATIIKILLSKKQILFKAEDVTVPEIPGAFTSFMAKNIPLFCAPGDFIHPEHYGKLMGFDKPIDFKLGQAENRDDQSKQS